MVGSPSLTHEVVPEVVRVGVQPIINHYGPHSLPRDAPRPQVRDVELYVCHLRIYKVPLLIENGVGDAQVGLGVRKLGEILSYREARDEVQSPGIDF